MICSLPWTVHLGCHMPAQLSTSTSTPPSTSNTLNTCSARSFSSNRSSSSRAGIPTASLRPADTCCRPMSYHQGAVQVRPSLCVWSHNTAVSVLD